MTKREVAMIQRGRRSFNSFEARRSYADAPLAVNPAATVLAAAAGNPGFAAQFDLLMLLQYYTIVEATGVWTLRNAAYILANYATLATQLAFFIFGNSDFAAGFARTMQAYPLSGGWAYGTPGIYGKDYLVIQNAAGNFPFSNVPTANLRKGDLVIPAYFSTGGTTVVALAVVRCSQVGYGTLLDALNSDRFVMNMVRYIMNDQSSVGLAQYNNQIGVYKQSLFGKFDSDFISPTSFKMPEQFQVGIIDIPLEKGIDKQIILGSYQNYDAVAVQWSVFVAAVEKIAF